MEEYRSSSSIITPNRAITSNTVNSEYPSNRIKSTESNVLTFIPLNIFHQLQSIANLYFILIAILQSIKIISVTNGKPTVLLPLVMVMLAVMIKDAIEEFNRYRKDRSENLRKVEVFREGNGFQKISWEDVQVGDVLRLEQDQMIPCDALIIKTETKDKCYLETKSLDGETSLKVRKGFTNNIKFKNMSEERKRALYKEKIDVEYLPPNTFLHHFNGFVTYKGDKIPVTIDNLILRSCFLRNVHEVYCICLYTGPETKVVLNSTQFNSKTSRLMSEVNKMVIQIFFWQLIIALSAALLNTLIENSHPSLMTYIPMSKFWILTWSWWLMMTYFVPISLIVTMETVKLFQGVIIEKDKRGYSKDYDCNISANNTSVNQNLGQIKYILSDKTGTLTKNQMSFKKLFVNGKAYGDSMTTKDQEFLKSNSKNIENVSFYDSSLEKELGSESFQNYLRCLYICHEILVEKSEDGKISYNSGSPDQIAFINFAKIYGKQLIEETDTTIKVAQTRSNQQTLKFDKLAFLEFNSDRKRMSKIIKNQKGVIEMYTKGADSNVAALLKNSHKKFASEAEQKATDSFSSEGLRTLMLAKKVISEGDFKKWMSKYERASSMIQGREQALDQCYSEIQKDLEFIGITAIEDKLQDEVAPTIELLKEVGIQFFILTGDKRQTAINIGRSCGVIGQNTKVEKIPTYNKRNPQQYQRELAELKRRKTPDVVYTLDASQPIPPDLPLHQTICYRCTPVQKENFVKFVKQNATELTLAIGDGANDVNMITQADVGVAVRGKEGSEAARVSDFVVGEFKFLNVLTLYYGREWYRKNSILVAYNFFKNWYHVSSVVVYGAYTYFSGVIIFDIYMYELFNMMFAAGPIIVFALFDYEYNMKKSLSAEYKQIYEPGLKNELFNHTIYFLTIGRGFFYGFVSLLVVFFLLENNVLTADGRSGYLAQSGSVLYFNIIVIINLRILVLSNGVSPMMIASIMQSIWSYWLIYWIYIETVEAELEVTFFEEWETFNIFFVHVIMIVALIATEFAYNKYMWFDRILKKKNSLLLVEKAFNSLARENQMARRSAIDYY